MPNQLNVLLLGSGGREHALAYKIARSPLLNQLYVAPGNVGMDDDATRVDLNMADHEAVIAFCSERHVDLVVIGPEAPLVAGLGDDLRAAGVKVFGPSKGAAQLEGSKAFTKGVCDAYDIPTATYGRFDNAAEARAYVEAQGAPIVVKADGLAAGKGVVVAMEKADAIAAVDACFDGAFGDAGAEVVIEEFLEGEEASFFALSDGDTILPLASAQDHKRVGDGDTGPNTGGMGAYSPAPIMDETVENQVMEEIIEPTIRAMRERGHPYQGVLFAGLMITKDGPKLIEHNCRFGDPECQVLMMRLDSDLLPLLVGCADGTLKAHQAGWHDKTALTVVLASKGYPGSYDKGTPINGIDRASSESVKVFHAGTGMDGDQLVATGGRVLNVTALGDSVKAAQKSAYDAVDQIDWQNGFCRRDIGWRAIEREES